MPINFRASPLRNGRSYSVWRIDGHQSPDYLLFEMEASFNKTSQGSIRIPSSHGGKLNLLFMNRVVLSHGQISRAGGAFFV